MTMFMDFLSPIRTWLSSVPLKNNTELDSYNYDGSVKVSKHSLMLMKKRLSSILKHKIMQNHRKWLCTESPDEVVVYVYNMITTDSKMKKGNLLEILCEHFYNKMGYDTNSNGAHRNGTRGDGGIDISARKGSSRLMIECKNWSKKIGVKTVRQFIGAMDKCPKTYRGNLVACSGFTSGCNLELASKYTKKGKTLKPKIILRDMNWVMMQLIKYGVPV